ncbi:MAG: DUF5916 domain-containing protein [Rubricoccaceae bacterium]|nr:DUF5916 domain-containing protein [Rubricoccaceae bacterium]
MLRPSCAASLCSFLILAAGAADAQPVSAPGLQAFRLDPGQRPRVDGRLDEAVWADAPKAVGFTQREPAPGSASSEHTEVAVLYDGEALYVGFWADVRDPSTLVARLARRDTYPISDRVSVDIDSYGDGRTAFSFAVTAGGVEQDLLIYNDVQEDATWDAVWEGEVAQTPGGYTAEFRIPFSQLRYPTGTGPQTWGIQFQRDIPASGEVGFWAPILPDEGGYVSRFGRLEGLVGLRAPRRIELLPYAAGRLTRAPGDAVDPFYEANDLEPTAGFDAKVGLTSNLTLTATVNPDFGQVEADPAVVNLSQFETFFEERRPFFVEGVDIFEYGRTRTSNVAFRPTFFYSRRIGREPSRSVGGREILWVDSPEQTTIATAAKVSGKVGDWSVGLLDAVTVEEEAVYIDDADQELRTAVEPFTNYLVGRVQRGFRGGASVVGGIVTATHRRMGDEGLFAGVLPSSATVVGLDVEHAWQDRAWTVSGVVAGSRVVGDSLTLLGLQRSPTRYFQRPDQTYLGLDPGATRLDGVHTELSLARTGGRHWRGSITGTLTSPGFEVNDLGFQSRADVASFSWFGQYRQPRPSRLNFYNVSAFGGWAMNLAGDPIQHYYQVTSFVRFKNLWSTFGYVIARPEYVNDRLTRGGPLALRPPDGAAGVELYTDRRRTLWGGIELQGRTEWVEAYDVGVAGGEWDLGVELALGWRPSDAVAVTVEPEWSRQLDTDQFFARLADGPAATFGTRYVFADIRREAFELGLRLDWTFTPDLSLQLFAEPFVLSGRYSGFKEFRTPRTYDFDVYGLDKGAITPRVCDGDPCAPRPAATDETPTDYLVDPGDGEPFTLSNRDFNFRSLRGNAVLRWEWRPGSTLFFVWQQTRDEFADYDGFGVVEELGEVFRAPVENVFLVKATYWLGL